MEKQAKKKGKKKELEEEATRQLRDVGDMLGGVSREPASASASASQVAPQSSQVVPTQAPQVKAPPQLKATPPAPPMDVAVMVPATPAATPAAFSTPPPPNRRRRARSEETEAASREDRLAVIARTAQSKSFAVHVAPTPSDDTFEADLEVELSRENVESREHAESHDHEPSREQQGESEEVPREYQICVICFEPCNPLDQEYPLEALPCAHMFHVACLSAWRETTRISDRARCPNGCHRVQWHPFFNRPSSDAPGDQDAADGHASRESRDDSPEIMSPGDVAFL
eukprot:symbB.v1.2.026374.t1/scaffold2629.1/size74438/4